MSAILRVLLIGISIITLLSMMKKIRKSKLQIEYAIFWVCFAGGLIVIAIFPEIIYTLAKLVGVASPVNAVYLIIIFVLLLKMFYQTIEISQLEYKIQELVQKIALRDKEDEENQEVKR